LKDKHDHLTQPVQQRGQ